MTIEKLTNSNMIETKSLFEFLGRAAGPELGLEVATTARAMSIPVETHYVHTRKYTGEIQKYPVKFLEMYFKNRNNGPKEVK